MVKYQAYQNREKMGVSAGKFHMFSRRVSKGKITTKKDLRKTGKRGDWEF
jgi:hypothetical protein